MENVKYVKDKYNISNEIHLIAVSKQKPINDILEAISAGQLDFGENRIQEAQDKIPVINHPNLKWHFIGHLQKNKAKLAVELFDVIHSIDKYDTAKEISKHCSTLNKSMQIFIQVNTTQEEQKSGVSPSNLEKLIEEIISLKHLEIIGLMTISLFTEDTNKIRGSFKLLHTLKDSMKAKFPFIPLNYLSMGMSGDYEIAIQEGATHIRLGTSIFGSR